MLSGTSANYQSKMCSDKEILDKRFLLLVNLLWRKKNRRGDERWNRTTRPRWLWQQSVVNQEMIRKIIEAYLKRKSEQAAFLTEKDGKRPYIPMCMVGLISPPCGQWICSCLVTRIVTHTALVAAPASWARTSQSVDATLSGEFEESF